MNQTRPPKGSSGAKRIITASKRSSGTFHLIVLFSLFSHIFVFFIPFIPKNNYFYDFFIFLFFLFNFYVILFILFLFEHFSVQPMKMMREMVSTFSRSLLLKQNFSLTRQTKGNPRLIWLQQRER